MKKKITVLKIVGVITVILFVILIVLIATRPSNQESQIHLLGSEIRDIKDDFMRGYNKVDSIRKDSL